MPQPRRLQRSILKDVNRPHFLRDIVVRLVCRVARPADEVVLFAGGPHVRCASRLRCYQAFRTRIDREN